MRVSPPTLRQQLVNPRRGDLFGAGSAGMKNGMNAATSPTSVYVVDDTVIERQAERIAELEAANAHLREALATRDLIWSAKVLIAATTGCGPEEAHELLIKQSQHENRKVREIAAEIVARR